MSDLSARPFERSDTDACLALFDSNVPEYFSDSERIEFMAFLRNLPGPYLLLERGADIVACGGVGLREDGRIADLCWGMVRRDLHGQGIGRTLTERRLDHVLGDDRVEEIALSTSQHTVGFYEALGFHVTETTPDGFGPGLDRCDMRRRSTPSTPPRVG